MNRRLVIFVSALLVLLVGGGLTSFIAAEGGASLIPGVLQVTNRPEASVSEFGQNQGWYFVAMVAFILFNLVGASVTGMAIFWFLNREVERAKVTPAAQHENLQEAFGLPRRTVAELPAEADAK